MSGYHDTYGGLVIDRERCAYCAAWPDLPCALHRATTDPHPAATVARDDTEETQHG